MDLSKIEGVGKGTILTILSEVGTDLRSFPTAKHFASWLHLAPNNKKTGGKIISKWTQSGKICWQMLSDMPPIQLVTKKKVT